MYLLCSGKEKQTSSVVILQPSMSPRLGGHYSAYWLDKSLFTLRHIVGPCQPADPTTPGEHCDLLWVERNPPPFSLVKGSFFVRYTSPNLDKRTLAVTITYGKNYVNSSINNYLEQLGLSLFNACTRMLLRHARAKGEYIMQPRVHKR